MGENAIEVKDVSKIYKLYDRPMDRLKESLGLSRKKLYKEHYALNNVSFEVKRGETVGIIGTNGSGKSTILKIITGVLNQSSGDVNIQGRISALLELGAGFNSEYTGIENVYLNGTMNGFSREEVDAKLNDILEFADIGDFVYQPVKTYSSGMFVRLAFAVAINIDPEILIVDEALSVGDVFFQAKCYHKFEEFKKMGRTILFVSHDLSSISKYCDRVILLNKGEKLAEGRAREMVDMYKKVLVNQVDTEGGEIVEKEADDTDKIDCWKDKIQLNPDFIEYGDKRAEIIDYVVLDDRGIISNAVQKNSEFQIKMKVRFNEDIKEPIFAFTLKDIKGTDITGTNTMYEKVYVSAKKGDVKEITFTQSMNLQGGDYLVSLGCTGYMKNEFVVYHRLYDRFNITVVSDKNTVGYYDMNSKIEIK